METQGMKHRAVAGQEVDSLYGRIIVVVGYPSGKGNLKMSG